MNGYVSLGQAYTKLRISLNLLIFPQNNVIMKRVISDCKYSGNLKKINQNIQYSP